jgi:Sulfotransferase family
VTTRTPSELRQADQALPYILPEERLAVFFSPKVAGTSMRAFLFAVENGFPLQAFKVQGVASSLTDLANNMVPNFRFGRVNQKLIETFERIAIVRDPVSRILSAYSNRVLHYRELSSASAGKALAKAGLTPDPDLGVLMANLDAYKGCSRSITRHFSHQEMFLGRSRAYYGRIFTVEAIGDMVDYINQRCGTKAIMPRLQDGGQKLDLGSLPETTRRAVIEYARKSVVFDWVPEYAEKYSSMLQEA